MNLPLRQAASQQWGDSGAGAGIGAGAQARPAHPDYVVGAVGFGANWQDDEPSLREMYEQACQTIVRLECEKEELVARIAVLEEEQKILAKGFPSPAKAAVTEGGTGYSGAERPEPSPHFPETHEAVERWQQGKINIFDEMARLERERDEARAQYRTTHLLAEALAKAQVELKAERDEAREQRKEAVEAICDFVNGQVWSAETWGNARHLRRLFEIAQAEGCK